MPKAKEIPKAGIIMSPAKNRKPATASTTKLNKPLHEPSKSTARTRTVSPQRGATTGDVDTVPSRLRPDYAAPYSVTLGSSKTPSSSPSKPPNTTLARLVHQFRHGRPMNKTEREFLANRGEEFWWIQSSSPKSSDNTTSAMDSSCLSSSHLETTPSYLDSDLTTDDLVQRADRLLSESDTVLDPAVSSDGLGSVPSSDGEVPYRPSFAIQMLPAEETSRDVSRLSLVLKPSNPQEDILYQWRLKRKISLVRSNATPSMEISSTIPSYPVLPRDLKMIQAAVPVPKAEMATQTLRSRDVKVQTSPRGEDNETKAPSQASQVAATTLFPPNAHARLSSSSSEEEYSDDELISTLRDLRTKYKERLRRVDAALRGSVPCRAGAKGEV